MQYIDDADFQIRIDDDQGANIASVVWREMNSRCLSADHR